MLFMLLLLLSLLILLLVVLLMLLMLLILLVLLMLLMLLMLLLLMLLLLLMSLLLLKMKRRSCQNELIENEFLTSAILNLFVSSAVTSWIKYLARICLSQADSLFGQPLAEWPSSLRRQ